MELPKALIDEIRHGRVVLFLGAGATVGALDSDGKDPLLGNDLRDVLVEKYLSPSFAHRSLGTVAELAMSETSVREVQSFIATKFETLSPSDSHRQLATFRWRAIATTNFDRVVEEAYRTCHDRLQDLVPILSNDDLVSETLRDAKQLAYLKLHGCISITDREDLPLILTPDHYATYRKNRRYVFERFEGWAREYPVVFVGHRIEDVNLREILLTVSESTSKRPRYFLVSPGLTEIDGRFWGAKRVTTIRGTLEEFVGAVGDSIPARVRPLLRLVDVDQPIKRQFNVRGDVPPSIVDMLDHEVEYVYSGMATGSGNPGKFYRGFGLGWYPIRAELDVRRNVTDTLLMDVIVRPEADRSAAAELYVIKAPAGAGKSVLLRRLAWEAGTEAEVISLYVRPDSIVSPHSVEELHRVTDKRVFIHWDNPARNVAHVHRLMRHARRKQLPVTVTVAERINEWNMFCGNLAGFVEDEFELRRLSEREISALVLKLEEHDCLGPNLRDRSHQDRVDEFVKVADRHLLVALHEATRGAPLSDILQDEFERIQPERAKQLYLTVCVLNRLRTPVRAGLMSRVHDIPFEEFQSELFSPLEQVVEARPFRQGSDFVYRARHPEIAQIVFSRVLAAPEKRLSEYLRIVGNLNLAFSTDRESFRGLLRARSLYDLFPEREHVRLILKKAEEVGSLEAYFYQQRANYERIHRDGNLEDAERFLEKARELDPSDDTILHTLALVHRAKAERSSAPLARQRQRKKARAVVRGLLSRSQYDAYARVTLVQLGLDDLRDLLEEEDPSAREMDAMIGGVERLLFEALQRHPGDEHLLSAEADLGELLNDDDRALEALESAFESNPRDPFIGNRLAHVLLKRGEARRAEETLRSALEGNVGDTRLNFQYGEILRLSGEADAEALAHYYERAFAPEDRSFKAKFWFARYAFECADPRLTRKSADVFRNLRSAEMPHGERVLVRDQVTENGQTVLFNGTLQQKEETYGNVKRDGRGDFIFVHVKEVGEQVWERLVYGDRVRFGIGFAFGGPRVIDLQILE